MGTQGSDVNPSLFGELAIVDVPTSGGGTVSVAPQPGVPGAVVKFRDVDTGAEHQDQTLDGQGMLANFDTGSSRAQYMSADNWASFKGPFLTAEALVESANAGENAAAALTRATTAETTAQQALDKATTGVGAKSTAFRAGGSPCAGIRRSLPLREQRFRLCLRRYHQLDPVVVEHVHQPGEAARRIGVLRGHSRHAGQHHRMKPPRQVDIVGVGARPAAQRRKSNHTRPPARLRYAICLPSTSSGCFSSSTSFSSAKMAGKRASAVHVVHLQLLHLQAPVIGAAVHAHHVQARLDQLDRRQEALALQPARIEPVGVVVQVMTNSTPSSITCSRKRPRIMASAMSETWNSSKQIRR